MNYLWANKKSTGGFHFDSKKHVINLKLSPWNLITHNFRESESFHGRHYHNSILIHRHVLRHLGLAGKVNHIIICVSFHFKLQVTCIILNRSRSFPPRNCMFLRWYRIISGCFGSRLSTYLGYLLCTLYVCKRHAYFSGRLSYITTHNILLLILSRHIQHESLFMYSWGTHGWRKLEKEKYAAKVYYIHT
jgi:hypothetical protein